MVSNEGERVAEGGQDFGIPGGGTARHAMFGDEGIGEDSDERKQAKQGGDGTQDGFVGPLTLRFRRRDGYAPAEKVDSICQRRMK